MSDTIKTVIDRAWTDIEPKVIAWFAAGGLLTVASIVYGYVFPSEPLPVWIAPVITLIGGAVVAYLKKSTVPVEVSDGAHEATPTVTEIPETPAP